MFSVTDPSVPIIFCEGIEDGLDPVFLHQIIPPGQAEIRPVGGKFSMQAFIEGHLASYQDNKPNYLGFRDRDFDVEPPDTPQLIRLEGQKPIFLTYRACIESYLLHSQGISDDFPKDKYKWWASKHLKISDHPDLQTLLNQLT